MASCDICGKPGENAGSKGILCEKHNIRLNQKSCGKKTGLLPIGGSQTPQGSYEAYRDIPAPLRGYPKGYIGWRQFCRKNGKNPDNADYSAYKKLENSGLAEVFRNERIVKEDAEWPVSPLGTIKARIKRSGF